MKIKNLFLFIYLILGSIIIYELTRCVFLVIENKKFKNIDNEYLKIEHDIEIYTQLKNQYQVLYDENLSFDNSIVELNNKIIRLKQEINDYDNRIEKINKELLTLQ